MSNSREDSESTDLPSTSNDVTRRPTLLGIIKEDNGPDASSATPPGELHPIDKEEGQSEDIQATDQHGSAVDDVEAVDEHGIRKTQPRKSLSSYAAPTKASKAKKNDKVEVSRPGSARPRAYSTHDNWGVGLHPRSNSALRSIRGQSASGNHSHEPVLEQEEEALQIQGSSVDQADSQRNDGADSDDVAKMIDIWKQNEQEVVEGMREVDKQEHLEKEETKKRLEELETELDEARELHGTVRRELQDAKDEIVSLRQHNHNLENMIGDLQVRSIERDEQTEVKLRHLQANVEDWKHKHDVLSTKNQELQERIEARNRLEPKLHLMEKVAAENKKLQAGVTQKNDEIAKTQSELKKVKKSLDELNGYAEEKDNEAYESNERLEALQKFMGNMSEVIMKWAQVIPNNSRAGLVDMDDLIQSFADVADTTELFVNTRHLLEKFVEKHELLESKLEDKIFENENIRKAAEEERKDAAQRSPDSIMSSSFILTPGLTGPQNSLLHDREGFESLYKKELAKRKAAEQKLQETSATKEEQSQLQQEKEELESHLKEVLDENKALCKETEDAKLRADLWLHESEQSKLELEMRSTEFESYKYQLEKEKDQYIRDYRTEAQDKSHWEAANLHKQLEDQKQEYKTLKQDFDRSKATNAHIQEEIASLEKKCMIQSAHIHNMQQAFLMGEELPIPPTFEDENSTEYDSDSDAFSPSSSSPRFPSFTSPKPDTRPVPIPRYELPAAKAARSAKLEAYRAELKAKTEEELLALVFKAPGTTAKKDRAGAGDILEKVRKWSLAEAYPPSKREWGEMRSKSAWERWEGEKWAVQCKDRRDIEILKKRGLLGK